MDESLNYEYIEKNYLIKLVNIIKIKRTSDLDILRKSLKSESVRVI